jgi:transposase
MPRSYPPEVRHQVVELARAGTRVKQLALTFGMTEATIYNWLRQDKIDNGEIAGLSTDQAIELGAAKRRIKQDLGEQPHEFGTSTVEAQQRLQPGLWRQPIRCRNQHLLGPLLAPVRALGIQDLVDVVREADEVDSPGIEAHEKQQHDKT